MDDSSRGPRYQEAAWKNRRNYYRILHVQPDAPAEIIRSSYRTLMQQLKQHPDLGGEHMQATLINEAYATLSVASARAAYDEKLLADSGESTEPASARDAKKPGSGGSKKSEEYEPAVKNYCSFCKTPHSAAATDFPEAQCADCGSPLWPATKLRIEIEDRRSVARTPKQQPIRFYTTWPQRRAHSGVTEDISVGGMRFATPQHVTVGEFVKIESEACRAVARVTNCRRIDETAHSQWRVGVEFVSLRFGHHRGVFLSAEA